MTSATLLGDDPAIQMAFSVYENRGVFAILIGSGVSRAAGIPTGWEITLDLVRRIALMQGVEGQADWAKWYREKAGREPNYSTLLEELALTPEERRSILHGYIEPTTEDQEEGRKQPTKAHLAIADLVKAGFIKVIITTNFDRLMENALREKGVEPTIVASRDALLGATPITHSPCYVLKLHGDYKDARILNTDAELGIYPPEYDRLLDRIFDEYGLIVAGWSGEWDHALRAAFLRAPNRRYPVYWATRSTPGADAQTLIAHRFARVIPIDDANGFFATLSGQVRTLAQSSRQNPLGIELLVSHAKRYLSRPEYRIQLDDLFADATERLRTKLGGPDFAPTGSGDPQSFRQRVAAYEAATEPLAKMAGTLGRWGQGDDLALVLDIIRALHADAQKTRSGLIAFVDIRSYPALLVLWTYALGLVRAERWSALHALCNAPITGEHGTPHRVVETLFLWDWEGDQERYWRQLEDMDKRQTPLSEHLCDLLTEWGKSFAGSVPDDALLFGRLELMLSLAHLGTTPESDLGQPPKGFNQQGTARVPIGHLAWHRSKRSRLFQELDSRQTRDALIQAGLAPSATFIQLFKQNLEQYADSIRWR